MTVAEDFRSRFAAPLARLAREGTMRGFALMRMPGNVLPWTDTGVRVDTGDPVREPARAS